VRGLRRNKSKKEERKEKTLQSAAMVEKEIPVRARHWREASAIDIRKGERRRWWRKRGSGRERVTEEGKKGKRATSNSNNTGRTAAVSAPQTNGLCP
jgi:hypothetical protein